jgi:hypothetical protein
MRTSLEVQSGVNGRGLGAAAAPWILVEISRSCAGRGVGLGGAGLRREVQRAAPGLVVRAQGGTTGGGRAGGVRAGRGSTAERLGDRSGGHLARIRERVAAAGWVE